MTVPADQMVLRPMLKPATIRQSPNDPVEVESLLPRVCQQCRDKMDTEKRAERRSPLYPPTSDADRDRAFTRPTAFLRRIRRSKIANLECETCSVRRSPVVGVGAGESTPARST